MHLSYRSNVICSNDRRKKPAGSGTRVLKSIASLSQRKRECKQIRLFRSQRTKQRKKKREKNSINSFETQLCPFHGIIFINFWINFLVLQFLRHVYIYIVDRNRYKIDQMFKIYMWKSKDVKTDILGKIRNLSFL